MLTAFRRHVKSCEHREKGRKYRRCRCPIWVDGFLGGSELRKSVGTRDWDEGQRLIRDWEAEGALELSKLEAPQAITLAGVCADFLAEAASRELQESTLRKYRQLVKQIEAFAAKEGLLFLKQWDVETVRRFRLSWSDKGNTVTKKLERMRALFRFAVDNQWIDRNPATKVKGPKVTLNPTLPFTPDEMARILAACERYQGRRERMKALILLLRYSGLRIGDAVRLTRNSIADGKVFLYTQKTGTHVWCPLPPSVVDAMGMFSPMNGSYFFWSGTSSKDGVARTYMKRLSRIFELAGIEGGHAHRFRDTFAVELLLAGEPLERIAILLGHSSTKVTEKHYAPWVKARQEQLEAGVKKSWDRDPLLQEEGREAAVVLPFRPRKRG